MAIVISKCIIGTDCNCIFGCLYILPEKNKLSYLKDFADVENKLLLQKDVSDSDLFE